MIEEYDCLLYDINSGVIMDVSDDPAQIVRFWHAVEMFSPQQLPRTDARNHVADSAQGIRCRGNRAETPPGEVRHDLGASRCIGSVYDLSEIHDVLVEYGQQTQSANARSSALFACTVDADRYLVEEFAVPVRVCVGDEARLFRGRIS